MRTLGVRHFTGMSMTRKRTDAELIRDTSVGDEPQYCWLCSETMGAPVPIEDCSSLTHQRIGCQKSLVEALDRAADADPAFLAQVEAGLEKAGAFVWCDDRFDTIDELESAVAKAVAEQLEQGDGRTAHGGGKEYGFEISVKAVVIGDDEGEPEDDGLGDSAIYEEDALDRRARVRIQWATRLAAGEEYSIAQWLLLSDEQLARAAVDAGVVEENEASIDLNDGLTIAERAIQRRADDA